MSMLKSLVVYGLAALLASSMAKAAPLAFTVLEPDRVAQPGTVEVFSGTITNETGADLTTGELFFDFFNIFDPAQLSFTQLLGTPDLALANDTSTGSIELFSVEIAPATPGGFHYFADVTLQSVNGDISDTATIQLSAIPEPSTALLTVPGLVLLALAARRKLRRAPGAVSQTS